MDDRYRKLTDELLNIFTGHTGCEAEVALDTKVYQYLRAEAPKAVLRWRCDREGHRPHTLVSAWANDTAATFRVACEYCGIELKEVDE